LIAPLRARAAAARSFSQRKKQAAAFPANIVGTSFGMGHGSRRIAPAEESANQIVGYFLAEC